MLIGGLREIRNHYLKTWFTIDFFSCLPSVVGYITTIISPPKGCDGPWSTCTAGTSNATVCAAAFPVRKADRLAENCPASCTFEAVADSSGSGAVGAAKALKILRLMRLAKLLRLARVKKMLEKYEDAFDANQYLGLIFTVLTIAFLAHMLACVWYLVGLGTMVGGDGEEVQGWVSNGDNGMGWTEDMLDACCVDEFKCEPGIVGIPYTTRLVIAMFSALDCSYANTDMEHLFLVFAVLVNGFIYGALAGVITTLMSSMAAGDAEFTAKLQSLKAWMQVRSGLMPPADWPFQPHSMLRYTDRCAQARELAKQDRSKIVAYYRASNKGNKAFNEAEILGACCNLKCTLQSSAGTRLRWPFIELAVHCLPPAIHYLARSAASTQ